jgi:hypothetical protein
MLEEKKSKTLWKLEKIDLRGSMQQKEQRGDKAGRISVNSDGERGNRYSY